MIYLLMQAPHMSLRLSEVCTLLMKPDRILTLHPQMKQGVNLDRSKYQQIRRAILDTIATYKTVTLKELTRSVTERLKNSFEGKIPWYVVTVKLDLEARRIIERVPRTRPHQIRRRRNRRTLKSGRAMAAGVKTSNPTETRRNDKVLPRS